MLTVNELKQIQIHRQHLTDKTDIHTICHDLNGIQAQFFSNAEHSLRIRCKGKIDKTTYGNSLVKNWTVRSTVHIFNNDDLQLYRYEDEENPYLSHVWDNENYFINVMHNECKMSPERIEYFSKFIVKRVTEGITFRDDLKNECIKAGMTDNERYGVFHSWGGLFMLLCQRGFLNFKVQEKKEFILCPSYIPMHKEAAQIEQARRYFTNFAPATIKMHLTISNGHRHILKKL